MKQSYEIPEVSVVFFDNEDIVTTSALSDLVGSLGTDNDIAFDFFNNN